MAIVDRRLSVTDGIAVKAPCRSATTANITRAGLQTVDGVPLNENDRVLVKSQTDAAENGIYDASSSNWTRSRDFDGAFDAVEGTRVFVTHGAINAGHEFQVSTAGEIAIGTTAIAFSAMGQAAAAASAIIALAAQVAAEAARDAVLSQQWSTGDVKLTMKASADTGWIMCNDGSIGKAGSGATTRANADTAALFALLYTNVSDSYAPVSGGRTGNAANDFAAGKALTLTKMLGRALAISGAGSGLTSRVLGFNAGVESVALAEADLPSHYHDVFLNDPGHVHSVGGGSGLASGAAVGNGGINSGQTLVALSASSNTTGLQVRDQAGGAGTANRTATKGSGSAHANMQPSAFLNAMIKL